jgi:hypothetical protein
MMRRVIQLVKSVIIGFGLLALLVLLFPKHMEPLWEWTKVTSAAVGYDALPSFAAGQSVAGLVLLVLAVAGILYTLWRDRRLEVLQAEYVYQTGAKNLKEKVRDLENRLGKMTVERNACQEQIAALNKKYTTALVSAKEHEVRGQFGSEDRAELRELRKRFEEVLRDKGHTEGFRVAMDLIMKELAHERDPSTVSMHSSSATAKKEKDNGQQRDALSYRLQ